MFKFVRPLGLDDQCVLYKTLLPQASRWPLYTKAKREETLSKLVLNGHHVENT